MGIYDRPYYRDDEPRGISLGGRRSVVANLIIINVAVFVIDMLVDPDGTRGGLRMLMAVSPDVLTQPWNWWKFLTYGFAHEHLTRSILHVAFNMYMLWLFGRDVESARGRKEFTLVYLSLVVFAGVAWAVIQRLAGGRATMIGASGAVTGVMILFVLTFPHRKFLIMFIPIPIPAWVLGIVYISFDLMGTLARATGVHAEGSSINVAYTCHLAGAAFAYLYFRSGVRLESLAPSRWSLKSVRPRPRLRVHDPEDRYRELDTQADRILAKLHRDGAESLTPKEQRILEDYSRRMRQKHR